MKPYYDHAGITIYHGDCRDVIASFPECLRVDALITDPPYGIGFDYGKDGHDDDPETYGAFVWSVVESIERRLVDDGHCLVFQSETTARMWPAWFPRPWHLFSAPKAFSQIRPIVPWPSTDFALYWRKDGKRTKHQNWHPSPSRDWFLARDSLNAHDRPDHPCPRPLDLMRYLVGLFVPPDGIVIDPFCGSGTTLLAAKNLGRRAIGIEREERHCETSAKRLAQEVLPGVA